MTVKEPSLFSKIVLAMVTPWTSRKLWLAIICLFILQGFFWTSVWYLYSFTDPAHITAFENMFQTIAWGIVTVVIGYILDMPTLLDGFKRTVTATTSQVVQSIIKKEEVKIDQNITVTECYDPAIEKKFGDRYATDESYRPTATVPEYSGEDFR